MYKINVQDLIIHNILFLYKNVYTYICTRLVSGWCAEENLKEPFAGGCVNSRAHAGCFDKL